MQVNCWLIVYTYNLLERPLGCNKHRISRTGLITRSVVPVICRLEHICQHQGRSESKELYANTLKAKDDDKTIPNADVITPDMICGHDRRAGFDE